MKLKAQLDNSEHELQLEFFEGRVIVRVDDRTYELDLQALQEGRYVLRNGTHVYECRVSDSQSHETFEVNLRGHTYTVTVIDPKRLRSGHDGGRHDHGSAQITAPMPGKVVRVLIEVGSQVEVGAGIVVVEAMKMQNEMKAPRAGMVTSITVKPGDTVNAGDVLAVVE